ncbi:MAG TPA: hypothetical protein VD860_00420 [Azospirillum sp.]|nr:hypothetical protein [Azospirillum sp.]
MVRLAVLATAMLTAMPATADDGVWSGGCFGQGAERRCSVSALYAYPELRGPGGSVTVTLTRDTACTALTVAFDGPLAPDLPARVAFDGAAPSSPPVREPRRLRLACAPEGRVLRIDFAAEPRTRTRVYHWVSLTERSLEVPLEGLRAALERLASEG